ncbi:MAG: recombinase family protein, partial [Phycisphaerae bacterium]|nr:recombinase family protein [Phycisphaerae bacterium]
MKFQRALIYVRVDANEQGKEAILDLQEERCRAFSFAKGYQVIEVISDVGKSAGNLNRQGIHEIMKRCESRSFDVLVIYKLDRLTHARLDLDHLLNHFREHEVGLISVTESFLDTTTAIGEAFVGILGILN